MLDFFYYLNDVRLFVFLMSAVILFSIILIFIHKLLAFYQFSYKNRIIAASFISFIGIFYAGWHARLARQFWPVLDLNNDYSAAYFQNHSYNTKTNDLFGIILELS